MRITINGSEREVLQTLLDQVLVETGYQSDSIATAVNGVFIHRQLREQTRLNEGDRLEVVAPIEGG